MNKRMAAVLVLITLGSLGLAIHAQLQLRQARAVVAEDLSGDPVETAPATAPTPAPAVVDADRTQALQQQVVALQAERAQLQANLAAAQAQLAARTQALARASGIVDGSNTSRRASFEERMAQLKRDDPARYEEQMKQREEFRQRLQTQADERSDFLKKIDTAGMTDEQRANHEQLTQTVEQVRALMAQIATMSPEDATAARQQMAATIGNVADLYQQERRYLLEQTARAIGYPAGSDATQFADYIQQIIDQTALPRGFGRGGNRPNGAGNVPTGGSTAAPAR